MKNRTNKILELLTQKNKIEVSQLSEKLGVSQVTVRKDLDELENKGIIKREPDLHSYAARTILTGESPTIMKQNEKSPRRLPNWSVVPAHSYDRKRQLLCYLADELASSKKDLTIITNSAFIADHIRGKSNFQIILLGGIYQQDSQVMVGPMIRPCVENFLVDLFFIGTDGYTPKAGFTNRDQMRAQAATGYGPAGRSGCRINRK